MADEQGTKEDEGGSLRGTFAAFGAYLFWGLFPLYWKRLVAVDPIEILCHRIVWAALFVLILLAATGRLKSLGALFRNPGRLRFAIMASILITANWGIYIWAINSGHVTESSLGYYINPLVSVALGAIFFRERMDGWTIAAVSVAAVGIAVASIMLGGLPWISLALALTFGFYGLVKKKAGLDPLTSLAAETLIASPFALAYIVYRQASGLGAFGGGDWVVTLMLVLAGAVTAVPLLLFASAANRISLTRMGFIQYVSPTLQLMLGLFVFSERVSRALAVAFLAVIAAVFLYGLSRVALYRRSLPGRRSGR
jgi:chloramphenicol-sensitive protein RarD